jgi:hypothetical protein
VLKFVSLLGLDANDLWALGSGLIAFGGALTVVLGLLRDELVVVTAGSAAVITSASVLLLLVATDSISSNDAGRS